MEKYEPKIIEKKWQKVWEEQAIFATPKDVSPENKYYILPQLPYPSGSGLHVGHAEVYTACDIMARYQRMRGKKVLQAIGWDSFGLPAENYAIKTNVHPRKSTNKAINNFRSQIKALGISVDWDREVGSHNPDYYKWTQWFFLLMYKRGLAYREKQSVNWCESCKTVLANEQVADGKCERCETVVLQKEMEQWYLRITEYADKLLQGLDNLDWPEETKKRQRDWIGKSEGASIRFKITNSQKEIEVFTTRPDTLFGTTYIVLSPEHNLVLELKEKIENWKEVQEYIKQTSKKTDLDRQIDQTKTGVQLKGIKAINPVNNEEIPVWIADYVLASYGTGAIMAVPAHDERDFEFAQKFGLRIQTVETEGIINNSDFLNDLEIAQAKEKIIFWLEEKGAGQRKIQYKLRDWSVSRQRFWGAPIPMLYDGEGELHPIPEEDLPVILPDDVDFKPTGEPPLNYSKDFNKGVEEKYGKGWKREPDTLDTFMCSSWYFFRYLDPKNDKDFASQEQLKKWMPVDFYLGGAEHVNGHLLYARFFTKVLYDAGYIDFDEPFTVNRHQGLILGADHKKMSKRWNNVVNPTDIVNEFGADTCRMYEMFMGPLEDSKPWDTNGVKGIRRFLEKVWRLKDKVGGKQDVEEKILHKTIKKITEGLDSLSYNTSIAKLMELANLWGKQKKITQTSFEVFLKMLAPFAPHMAEELWNDLGNKKTITYESWPKYDERKIIEENFTLAIQVNGKMRATIEVPVDISNEDVEREALNQENIQKWLNGKKPKKVIYIKGKLISIVV